MSLVTVPTRLAPAATGSGNLTAVAAVDANGAIYFTWWPLGQGANGFTELPGNGRTGTAPAVALVGPQHNYLYALVKGMGDTADLYLNQGVLGGNFTGWNDIAFATRTAPAITAADNTIAIVATDPNGHIFYSHWQQGGAGTPFVELNGDGQTDAAPAAALVGPQHNYLFVVVKGLDGNLYVNQGVLGGAFVGWNPFSPPPPPPVKPVIDSFTAAPVPVPAGGTVTLNWSVSNAANIWLFYQNAGTPQGAFSGVGTWKDKAVASMSFNSQTYDTTWRLTAASTDNLYTHQDLFVPLAKGNPPPPATGSLFATLAFQTLASIQPTFPVTLTVSGSRVGAPNPPKAGDTFQASTTAQVPTGSPREVLTVNPSGLNQGTWNVTYTAPGVINPHTCPNVQVPGISTYDVSGAQPTCTQGL
ncbi:hypothetical protein [Kitasatospora sp. SUK 42]|uniref:hypothetical protein n=1 Tax=Kitasatospora sp. SUK 42 TaxID=1588882 RepID=UPI0018CB5366|nr:hypothetical protein [Kitasatospora sp. SUK 42]MBV2153019.1 hypothetical protein [Kitasatospora sp. SUK 42]